MKVEKAGDAFKEKNFLPRQEGLLQQQQQMKRNNRDVTIKILIKGSNREGGESNNFLFHAVKDPFSMEANFFLSDIK